MAVATGTLRRRQQKEAQAAKAKRDKVILAVGCVILLAALAFELPKVMHSGSSSPSTTTDTTATDAGTTAGTAAAAAPAAPVAITPAQVKHDLQLIAKLPTKDPFQPQLSTGTIASSGTQPFATPPHVRLSHFVAKDPFKAQVVAPGAAETTQTAKLATPPAVTQTPSDSKANAPFGFIVILRSLDTKKAGLAELKKARAQGLRSAGLLYSSKYTSLRHGYWVLYLSKYPSAQAADAGLQFAHTHGYGTAYRRPVKK